MVNNLYTLQQKIYSCKRCHLSKTAKSAVPGEGNPNSQIMFIGEAPGKVEDETGRPFVGRAGRLLNTLIDSINLKRELVFITNVVKHRPSDDIVAYGRRSRSPKNRQPKKTELKACSLWLDYQLSFIKPKLVITLGRFALEYFFPKEKISLIHGTIKKIERKNKTSLIIFPVYHPAAGLRNLGNRQKLFKDFQKLKLILHDLI